MRITLHQVRSALIVLAEQNGRPYYEVGVVRDVHNAIIYEYHHDLKHTVMQEIFTLYTFVADEFDRFNADAAVKKMKKVKGFYGGQKALVIKSGVCERTISLIIKDRLPLTPYTWKRISPVIDQVLMELKKHSEEKEKNSHGMYVTYRRGCRCQPCKFAWKTYLSDRAAKKNAIAKSAQDSLSLDD